MRSRDERFWMWAEALDLLQGGEQLRRRFFTVESLQSLPCWEPSVDLYENADELRLLVALPGVNSRQVEVLLDEQGLLVRGERPIPSACQQAAIHRLEIPYGRFERRIALPPGHYRLSEQFIEEGCLVLVLRRH
ncbi:MAG: Hsp20/alpha crystallin family protein [Candidatus Accumulibacter sp.]|nr:Hsp20/alpha crystallin family protein [Accumulibacter sp.]